MKLEETFHDFAVDKIPTVRMSMHTMRGNHISIKFKFKLETTTLNHDTSPLHSLNMSSDAWQTDG